MTLRNPVICLCILFLVSCKPGTQEVDETTVDTTKESTLITIPQKRCYAYDKDDNLIGMTISVDGDKVTGQLAYAYADKDRNAGTIKGYLRGDTLIADYTFSSEGRRSVREVVFISRDNLLLEGYGDVEERDGKMAYKNRATLNFDNKMPMKAVPCHK